MRPESEKFGSGLPLIGRGRSKRMASPFRAACSMRTARIAEAKKFGRLVKGFPHRIVDGGADPHILADIEHRDELRMPARDEQQQIGESDPIRQPRRQGMASR